MACVAIKTMFAIRTASNDGGIKNFEIVAAITACIDLVVSIASVVMGALHLSSDDCHQTATFVLVNGCITLPFTLIAIALTIARFYGHSDFNIGGYYNIFAFLSKFGLTFYFIPIFVPGKFEIGANRRSFKIVCFSQRCLWNIHRKPMS